MPHIRSSVFFRPLLRAEGLIGRFWPICFGKCKLFICEEILEKYGKVTTPQSNGLFWGLKHFENGWNFPHTFLTYTKFKFCKKKGSKTTTQTWDLSKKFTLLDFWDKNFTPLISPNFKSFGDKTQKQICENGEIYTADKNFTLPPEVTARTNSTSEWAGMYNVDSNLNLQPKMMWWLKEWRLPFWKSPLDVGASFYLFTTSLNYV